MHHILLWQPWWMNIPPHFQALIIMSYILENKCWWGERENRHHRLLLVGGHLVIAIKMWNIHVLWSSYSSSRNLSYRNTQVPPKFIARASLSALFPSREKNRNNLNVHKKMPGLKRNTTIQPSSEILLKYMR